MRKLAVLFSSAAIAGGVLLSGCSKSPDRSAPGGVQSGGPSGPVELKVKWTVGKKYMQRLETTMTSEVNMPRVPKPVPQVIDVAFDYSISALGEREGGGRELELELAGGTVGVKIGERTMMNFDSAQDSSLDGQNPAATYFRRLIGARLKYLTDAGGKVEKVEGIDELVVRVAGATNAQAQAAFRSGLGEAMLKQFGELGRGLPDHAVKAGDKWPVKMEIAGGPMGNLVLDLKSTFKRWEQHNDRNCVRLEYAGSVSAKGASVTMDKGKISGVTWFDPELGMVVDSNSDQEMTMKSVIQGKSRSIPFHQKVSMRLADVTDLAN